MHRSLMPVFLSLSVLLSMCTMTHATSYRFITIDVPGATQTQINGINDRGQIVGGYLLPPGGPHTHGFLAIPKKEDMALDEPSGQE